MSVELVPAALVHAELLAGMHRICFVEAWSAASMAGVLAMPGAAGLIAVAGDSLVPARGGSGPAGLVLWRLACDEAEILTLAVLPPWRRDGLGRRLVQAACDAAADAGAATMFLEVAATNQAALTLYQAAGFTTAGLRKGYYAGVDGLTMQRRLAIAGQ
jgi:[ribosomal protein S18]-alanine N-acetyltransferase